jgi:hypothetical protein
MMAQLSAEAQRVLRALAERAMDGYALMAVTGLKQNEVETAVTSLLDLGLIRVEGTLQAEEFGKAYLWVPPSVQGKADFLLGKLAL